MQRRGVPSSLCGYLRGGRWEDVEAVVSLEFPSTNLPFAIAIGFWFALPCRLDAFDKIVPGIALAKLLTAIAC